MAAAVRGGTVAGVIFQFDRGSGVHRRRVSRARRTMGSPSRQLDRLDNGLRAWRALTLLLGVVVTSAFFLMTLPLHRDDDMRPTFGDALLFAGQSGLSLSGPGSLYSTSAQVVQIALRVIVPILVALAVLSLRARVKC